MLLYTRPARVLSSVLTAVLATMAVALPNQVRAQRTPMPFPPAERDRLLTMCELGRQVSEKGDTAGAQQIIDMVREATPRPTAAMDLCMDYTRDFINNPKNATHLRIKQKAREATENRK
jgi:hypothetical protein